MYKWYDPIKTCKVCLRVLPREMMRLSRRGTILENKCRGCRRVTLAEYRKDKDFHKALRGTICNRCKFTGMICQFDGHHIDGDHFNNDPSNIETLCANCHRLHTWKERQNA